MFGERISGESRYISTSGGGGVAPTASSPPPPPPHQSYRLSSMADDDDDDDHDPANQGDSMHTTRGKRPLVFHNLRQCNSLDSGMSSCTATKCWEKEMEDLIRYGQTVRGNRPPHTRRTSPSQSLHNSMQQLNDDDADEKKDSRLDDNDDRCRQPAKAALSAPARLYFQYRRSYSTCMGSAGSWDDDQNHFSSHHHHRHHHHHHMDLLSVPRLDHDRQGQASPWRIEAPAAPQKNMASDFVLARTTTTTTHGAQDPLNDSSSSCNAIFRVRGGGGGEGGGRGGPADNSNENDECTHDSRNNVVSDDGGGGGVGVGAVDDVATATITSSVNVSKRQMNHDRFPLITALGRALRQEQQQSTSPCSDEDPDEACSAVATVLPTNSHIIIQSSSSSSSSNAAVPAATSSLSLREWIRTSAGIFSVVGGGEGKLDVPPISCHEPGNKSSSHAGAKHQPQSQDENATSVAYDDEEEEEEIKSVSSSKSSSDPINTLTSMLLTSTFPSFAFGSMGGGIGGYKNKASSSSTQGAAVLPFSTTSTTPALLLEDRDPSESEAMGDDDDGEDVLDTSSIMVASVTGEKENNNAASSSRRRSSSSSSSDGNAHDRQEEPAVQRRRRPVAMQRTTDCIVYKGEGFEVTNWETPLVGGMTPSSLRSVNTNIDQQSSRRRHYLSSNGSSCSSTSTSSSRDKPDAFDLLLAKLPDDENNPQQQQQDFSYSNALPLLQSVNTDVMSRSSSSDDGDDDSNKQDAFDRLVAPSLSQELQDITVGLPSLLQAFKTTNNVARSRRNHLASLSHICSPVSDEAGSKPDAFDRLIAKLPEENEQSVLPLLQSANTDVMSHSSSSSDDDGSNQDASLRPEPDEISLLPSLQTLETTNVVMRKSYLSSPMSSPVSDYTSKLDVFDRLVAMLPSENQQSKILPSSSLQSVNTNVKSHASSSSTSSNISSPLSDFWKQPDAFDRLVARLNEKDISINEPSSPQSVKAEDYSTDASLSKRSSPMSDDASKPDAFDRLLANLTSELEETNLLQSVNTDVMSHTSSCRLSPVSEDVNKLPKDENGQDKRLQSPQSVNTEIMSHSSHSSISEDDGPDAFDLLVAPLRNQDKNVMSAQDDYDYDNDDCSQVSTADSIDDIRRYEQAQQQKEQSNVSTGIFGWWSSVRSLPKDQESDDGSVWDMGGDTHDEGDDTNFRDPWLVDEYESEYADLDKSAQPYPILGIPTKASPTSDAMNDDSRGSSLSNGTGQLVLSRPLMESLRPFLPWSKRSENYWLKYSMGRDGASMHIFLHQARGAKYSFLAIETVDGEVFGSFTAEPWRKAWNYFGSGESFLWRMQGKRTAGLLTESELEQRESKVDVFPFSYQNDCIQLCSQNCIAVGAGSNVRANFSGSAARLGECVPSSPDSARGAVKDAVPSPPASPTVEAHQWGFGLMIQEDLLHGTSSPCLTFGSPSLAIEHSDGSLFEILNLELWTLSPCMQLEEAQKMELRKLLIEDDGVPAVKL